MKNYKLLTLAICFFAASLMAQTADQDVTNGLASLTAHNLTSLANANSDFSNAVVLSSANENANALLAATRLLVLPQQPAGSNLLTTLTVSTSGRNIYGWTATLPTNSNGAVFPDVNSSVAISYYRTTVMAALGASLTNLSRITDPGYTLMLTAAETDGGEDVTLDYGDILLIQSELYAAEFFGYTLNAQNFDVVASQLQTLSQSDGLTIQALLADYPSLLAQNNAADLANSKGALTNAIAFYQAASNFIHNSRVPGNGLFLLEPDQVADEAAFRTDLTNVLLSLNQPVQFNPNQPFSLYISNYFTGAKSVRSLVPQFSGDYYVNSTLPDYTFGGILVGEPAFDTELFLRQSIGYDYAGIYIGNGGLSDNDNNINSGNGGYGGFAVFVGTNQQATLIGADYGDGSDDGYDFGLIFHFSVDKSGNWSFQSNNISAYGNIDQGGDFNGEIDGLTDGNGNTVSVYLNGNEQSPLGNLQNAAGYYGGTYSGIQSGSVFAIVAADAELFFCPIDSTGSPGVGDLSLFNPSNHFTFTSLSGTVVAGTLNTNTFALSGNYTNSGAGTFSMTRSAKVPFDVPPAITVDLPPNKSAALGTNVTFSVSATGSPPLCYQWYFNSVPIPNATTNTLVVSNLQYSSAGVYGVAVENVAGRSNSTLETLTVTAETVPPTIHITAPTSGLQVSNALYTVAGNAEDNVAVSNVWVQLNGGGWNPVTSFIGTNWTAQVTLTPGPNTVQAYAVDTSGNVSTTNTVNFNYVVSAVLTVQLTGKGTVSPDYSNAVLAIGTTNSMTAAVVAGSGFEFTNWTGGTSLPLAFLTNGPTVKFVMASNLVLQANFVDTNRPTVSVTNVTAGMSVSNAAFTVKGTASDNVAVSNVYYWLSNSAAIGPWTPASTSNNGSNWMAAVTLAAGTNTVAAYAVDTSGNVSPTNTVSFIYVVSAVLTVTTNGLGSLSQNYNGALLKIGQSYSITATPGTGFIFTNWTAGTNMPPTAIITNGPTVQFFMVSNLMLQANFVDVQKPVLTITAPTANQHMSNALATVVGTASDNWKVNAVWYLLTNGILTGGTWNLANTTNNYTNWTTTLKLAVGTNTVKAYAVDMGGNLSTTSSVSFISSNTFQLLIQIPAAQPVMTNGLDYSLQISPGLNGHIQVSSNLVNWLTLTNFIGTNSTINLRDPSVTNFNLRFYRAVVP